MTYAHLLIDEGAMARTLTSIMQANTEHVERSISMTHHLTLTASSVILTAALLLGAPAEAAEMTFDRATHITLEDPVRVPGATLPAGDYVFTLSASAGAA